MAAIDDGSNVRIGCVVVGGSVVVVVGACVVVGSVVVAASVVDVKGVVVGLVDAVVDSTVVDASTYVKIVIKHKTLKIRVPTRNIFRFAAAMM